MKRISKVLLFTILLSINVMIVRADECEYSGLYLDKSIIVSEDGTYADVYLYVNGIRKNMYVIVEDTLTNETKRYDINNLIENSVVEVYEKVTQPFTFKASVYSDECGEEPIEVFEFEHKSTINRFAYRDLCLKQPEFDMCDIYYDTGNMSDEEFENEYNKWYKESVRKARIVSIKSFLIENVLIILLPIILIMLFFIIRLIVLKVKTSKDGRLGINNEKSK